MDYKIIIFVGLFCFSCGSGKIVLQEENFLVYDNYIGEKIVFPGFMSDSYGHFSNKFDISFLNELDDYQIVDENVFNFLINLPIMDSLEIFPRDTSVIKWEGSEEFIGKLKKELDILYCGKLFIYEKVDSYLFLYIDDGKKVNNVNALSTIKNRYLVLINVWNERVASVVVMARYFEDGESREIWYSKRRNNNKINMYRENESSDVLYQKKNKKKVFKMRPIGGAIFGLDSCGNVLIY